MWSLFAATVQRAAAQARHSERELSARLAQEREVWDSADSAEPRCCRTGSGIFSPLSYRVAISPGVPSEL
jgi:hypothetical protein